MLYLSRNCCKNDKRWVKYTKAERDWFMLCKKNCNASTIVWEMTMLRNPIARNTDLQCKRDFTSAAKEPLQTTVSQRHTRVSTCKIKEMTCSGVWEDWPWFEPTELNKFTNECFSEQVSYKWWLAIRKDSHHCKNIGAISRISKC